jgi:prepilin-type N-terminal cleavage/methylation domain-containing protein
MKRGFTVVELVMVIALLAIEAFMLGPPLTAAVKEYALVASRRQALAEARTAMDRMVKEIRLIPSSAAVVSVASPTNFQFQYPLGTAITYSLNGTTLERNGIALASNVGVLQFKYYDSSGSETANPANVNRVMIWLTTNVASGGGTLPLATTVFLRNTGNEYGNFTSP